MDKIETTSTREMTLVLHDTPELTAIHQWFTTHTTTSLFSFRIKSVYICNVLVVSSRVWQCLNALSSKPNSLLTFQETWYNRYFYLFILILQLSLSVRVRVFSLRALLRLWYSGLGRRDDKELRGRFLVQIVEHIEKRFNSDSRSTSNQVNLRILSLIKLLNFMGQIQIGQPPSTVG